MTAMRLVAKIFCLVAVLCFSPAVEAQDGKRALADIEKYINSLTTARGTFKQLTSGGGYATGKFYLSRPGKIRFDYDPPNNILLMADGKDFIYHDIDLVQVTYLSMNSSIAGVLVKDSLSFSDPEFKVENVSFVDGTVRVAVSSLDDPLAGKIILIFKEKPLSLYKWQIIDAQGIATTILLEDMEYGIKLEDRLFIFDDPRHKIRNRSSRK